MEEILKNLTDKSSGFILDLLVALIIFIIGFRIVNFIESKLKKTHKFTKLDSSVKGFLISFLTIGLKTLIIVIVLSIVGVPMASLVTVIGSGAVAIGLALQGGLSNIAGGLMLLIFKPFKVGDFISANSMDGTVKSITMFYTTIVTPDNKTIQLPNGNLSNSVVTNYSRYPERLLDIPVSVDYKSNLENVKKVLNKIALECQYRIEDKDILIALKAHSESSLDFTFRIWVKNSDYWQAKFEILEKIKKEFDKNNISIPFPQLDVHVNK